MSQREDDQVDELDRIDRSIDIDASAEKVWGLVSRPGWWINSRTIVSNQTLVHSGGVATVVDAVHGTFPIRVERLEPPTYAAFRWLTQVDDVEDARPGTLVEFFITDRPEGGVVLRVVESGFSALADDRQTWLTMREGNVEGWAIELEAARAHHDPTTITRAVRLEHAPDAVRRGLPPWDGATIEVREHGAGSLVVLTATGFADLEDAERRWDHELSALVARHGVDPAHVS